MPDELLVELAWGAQQHAEANMQKRSQTELMKNLADTCVICTASHTAREFEVVMTEMAENC